MIDVSKFGKEHYINYGSFRHPDISSFNKYKQKLIIPENSVLCSSNFSSFKRAIDYLKYKQPYNADMFEEWCENFMKSDAPDVTKFQT